MFKIRLDQIFLLSTLIIICCSWIVPVTSVTVTPTKGKPTAASIGKVTDNLDCIQCNKCELGVFVVVCKKDEMCFSYSEISEQPISSCNCRNWSAFISGEFDNNTFKGCTLDGNYCDQHSPPCYTCDWDLCNPKDHKSFNGRSPGIATLNSLLKLVAGIISIALICESRN